MNLDHLHVVLRHLGLVTLSIIDSLIRIHLANCTHIFNCKIGIQETIKEAIKCVNENAWNTNAARGHF